MKKLFVIVGLILSISNFIYAQYGDNLLTNPGAEDTYTGWTKTDGGNGWALNQYAPPHSGSNCWSSSYSWCTLVQTVTLTYAGYSGGWLDTEPDIYVGVYAAQRYDHAGKYEIKVELLNAGDGVEDTWTTGEVDLSANTDWFLISNTFSSYGTGIRKVKFTIRGEDGTPDWGEQYGTSFDDAFIKINESSLPVELSQFKATQQGKNVLLNWITESEINNAGFILERKSKSSSFWDLVSTYETNNALLGQGNTSQRTEYTYLDMDVPSEEGCYYRLSDVSTSGILTNHPPIYVELLEAPEETRLDNAYPNPFNPETYIAYHLAEPTQVNITVFDLIGRSVKELYDGMQSAGSYHVYWNSTDNNGLQVSNGHYFIRMQTEKMTEIKKVILMK